MNLLKLAITLPVVTSVCLLVVGAQVVETIVKGGKWL